MVFKIRNGHRYDLQYRSYVCVPGLVQIQCLGVYYFTRVCSTEQEKHCNDEPMGSGCQHLSNHPSLCC